MSDTIRSLVAISPLTGLALPAADGIAAIVAADTSGRLLLRADLATARQLEEALGLSLETPINRAAVGDICAALRLGPDEWLLLADAERDPWLSARIAAATAGAAHSLVDVTHRSASLLLSGDAAEAVLAAGCPLPLDIATFPVGRATRTLLAKAEVVLWRRARNSFHIEVAASLVPYAVGLLAQAIADEAAITRHCTA